jgi:hypothetical protein
MMILRNTKYIKMVRRSLLLRVLLNTRILVPSTTKRCLRGLEGLFVADVPAETLGVADVPAENLVMQRSPAENLLTQRSPAGLTCHHSVPLRGLLLTQTYPAKHT